MMVAAAATVWLHIDGGPFAQGRTSSQTAGHRSGPDR
jgi:hypothetical protein